MLQLASDNAGVYTQRSGHTKYVSFGKERCFASDERIHRLPGHAEVCGSAVRNSLVFGNIWPRSCALAFELGIDDNLILAVPLNYVFEFVAENKPKIINSVMSH